jgi:Divergent InlB B-repeat domain
VAPAFKRNRRRAGLAAAISSLVFLASAIPARAVVLYDQTDNPATGNIGSQDFETSFDTFDAQAADDFTVPIGQAWTITDVDVLGEYSAGGGPAASFNVSFRVNAEAGNLPGPLVASRPASTYTESSGTFSVALKRPVTLGPGLYWVSVQARQDFNPAGQWFWGNRSVQAHQPAAWRNPGDAQGTGCTSFTVKTACLPTQVGPDQLFRLLGTAGQVTPYATQASTGTVKPGTTDIGNHCDDCTTLIPLPFPVEVYDSTFTHATASSNGNLQFDTSSASSFNGCPPNGSFSEALLAYQGDLRTSAAGDGIFTRRLGSAPHRTFLVEWRASYPGHAGNADFEVKLYEDTPTVTVIYGPIADNGVEEASGVQSGGPGQPGTVFSQFSCLEPTLTSGVRVDYVPDPRTLSVTKTGAGSGRVTSDDGLINCGATCERIYAKGTHVTLAARPSAGSLFAHWSGSCSGSGDCSVAMNSDRAVSALFKPAP